MTFILEENFEEALLNPNIWEVNKIGFITGITVPAIKVYHITDAEPNLFSNGNSKGNQHEAKVNIPDNCDISFTVAINDPIPTSAGQVGIALVKPGISGLPNNEDNKMLLFVGQQDANRDGASSENVVIGSHSLSIMSGDYSYRGSTALLFKGLDSELPQSTSFKIEKRGNSYTVYDGNNPICSTTFGGNVRLSIGASTLDPCLWFIEWGELQNLYVDAL